MNGKKYAWPKNIRWPYTVTMKGGGNYMDILKELNPRQLRMANLFKKATGKIVIYKQQSRNKKGKIVKLKVLDPDSIVILS